MSLQGSKINDGGRNWLVCRKPSPNPSWTPKCRPWAKLITKHQWYGYSNLRQFKKGCHRRIQFLNTWIMVPSLLPQFWKCFFSVVNKYFCLYSVSSFCCSSEIQYFNMHFISSLSYYLFHFYFSFITLFLLCVGKLFFVSMRVWLSVIF